jgi:hypothetical protein
MVAAGALLVAIALAAGATWLRVARTINHPRPVKISKQPKVTALAWSGRVFVDAATFKHWLAARNASYASWAHRHPRGVALLEHKRARR